MRHGIMFFLGFVIVPAAWSVEPLETKPAESFGSEWSSTELLPVGDSLSFTVSRAVSGDTLELDTGKHLKLLGVVSPRIPEGGRPGDYYSKEAREFLDELARGKKISVTFEKRKVDSGGRWLGYAWLPDGDFLNYRLLSEGYGFWDRKAQIRKEYRSGFEEAERIARDERLGIWKDPGKASALYQEIQEKRNPRRGPEATYYDPSKSFVPDRVRRGSVENKPANPPRGTYRIIPPHREIVPPYTGSGTVRKQTGRHGRSDMRRYYRGRNPYLYSDGTFTGLTPITAPLRSEGVRISPPRGNRVQTGTHKH